MLAPEAHETWSTYLEINGIKQLLYIAAVMIEICTDALRGRDLFPEAHTLKGSPQLMCAERLE